MNGNITLKSIFINVDRTKIKGDCDISRTYHVKDNRELCVRIAGRFLKAIITDVILGKGIYNLTSTGSTFISVIQRNTSKCLEIKKLKTDSIICRTDPMKTGFKFYNLELNYNRRGFKRKAAIYVGGELKDLFEETINSGHKYNTSNVLKIKDYIPIIKETFPLIHDKSILYIMKFIAKHIINLILLGHSLYLAYNIVDFSMFVIMKEKSRHCYVDQRNLIKRNYRKVAYLEKQGRLKYDDYYYFQLSERQFKELNETGHISKVMIFRIKECLNFSFYDNHLFRIKKEKGNFKYYIEEGYEKSDVEYVSRRNKFRFRSDIVSEQCSDRLFERNADNI